LLGDALAADSACPGRFALLRVSDEGVGIDADIRSRLFEPFFSTKFTGRGLGLASVLGIVRSHSGVIRVESQRGQGSTFEVFLPLAEGGVTPFDVPAEVEGPATGGRVILVDDDATIRKVMSRMLTRAGFDVVATDGGQVAVDLLAADPAAVDCVVLDLTMPGMVGEEALARLRSLRDDLPVVVCSGYGAHEAADRTSDAPHDAFVQKPFTSATLVTAIRHAIGRSATRDLAR
jgi:CheY-like chemotaxis protein